MFKGRHVMVDTETLSTSNSAIILQLGACEFFPEERRLGRWFNFYIELGSALRAARTFDPETFYWWLDQSKEAQDRLWTGVRRGGQLTDVLMTFGDWLLNSNGRQGLGRQLYEPDGMWSHGASFDLSLLKDSYESLGIPQPWSYTKDRDTRTLFSMANGIKVSDDTYGNKWTSGYPWPEDAPKYVPHCALSDSIAQAITVMRALDILEGKPRRERLPPEETPPEENSQ